MSEDKLWLVDTNVLVYAFDLAEPDKRAKAQALLERCWNGEIKLAVSLQNLTEFFFIITKKIPKPLSAGQASKIVDLILDFDGWVKLLPSKDTLRKAMKYAQTIPFWDAMITAVMLENNVFNIYTEDTQDFTISGITAKNPFT